MPRKPIFHVSIEPGTSDGFPQVTVVEQPPAAQYRCRLAEGYQYDIKLYYTPQQAVHLSEQVFRLFIMLACGELNLKTSLRFRSPAYMRRLMERLKKNDLEMNWPEDQMDFLLLPNPAPPLPFENHDGAEDDG